MPAPLARRTPQVATSKSKTIPEVLWPARRTSSICVIGRAAQDRALFTTNPIICPPSSWSRSSPRTMPLTTIPVTARSVRLPPPAGPGQLRRSVRLCDSSGVCKRVISCAEFSVCLVLRLAAAFRGRALILWGGGPERCGSLARFFRL